MSNLSDIGFPVASDQDVNQVLMDVLPGVVEIPCAPFGSYYRYSDASGAELYLQANIDQELIGFNPAFAGGCIRKVELERSFSRDTSELDGAFVARESDGSTFVFDCPDFRAHRLYEFPLSGTVELTAFASNDLAISPGAEWAPESAGIHQLAPRVTGEDGEESFPLQAHVRISAEVVTAEELENSLTGARFFSIEADTGTGVIRVVADPKLIKKPPAGGERLVGSFWLSGKVSVGNEDQKSSS